MEIGFHRGGGDPGVLGSLRNREVLQIPQMEYKPFPRRKLFRGLENVLPHIGLFELPVRIVFGGDIVGGYQAREKAERETFPCFHLHSIVTAVNDDLVEPCVKFDLRPVGAQLLPHLNECFLNGVLCPIVVVKEPEGQCVRVPLMSLHEQPECVAIAPQARHDQFVIGSSSLVGFGRIHSWLGLLFDNDTTQTGKG
jgi:hypothetical protein